MKYPLTFYVESLPPNVGGCANGPVIRILEKYRGDEGIYRHELVHVKQWAVFFFVGLAAAVLSQQPLVAVAGLAAHSLLYKLVGAYRLHCEVDAYREQLKHYPDDRRELFARFIERNYGLDVMREEALRAL